MGGSGSGNWYRWEQKDTVEDCRSLDVNWMTREGIFDGPGRRSGSLQWTDSRTGETRSSIAYEVSTSERWLRLHYRFTESGESFDYKVPLTTTALPWGGVRWWFVCALSRSKRFCGRRVGKLYLPPGGRFYGCRHCYDLTYESCQESHRYDRMWAMVAAQCRMDPARAQHIWESDAEMERRLEKAATRREQKKRRMALRMGKC